MTFEIGDRVQWSNGIPDNEWIGTVINRVPGAVQVHWDGCDEPDWFWYATLQVRKLNTLVIAEVE